MNRTEDSVYSQEKQFLVKSLEVQFNILAMDRKLKLAQRENQVSSIKISFLATTLLLLTFITIAIIFFLRRINQRDRLILRTNEELSVANDEKKRLKEQHLLNEIEFKESQLMALTLQMLQKNELLQEFNEKYMSETKPQTDNGVTILISKVMNQDKDWNNFNAHFESINRNFSQRIKKIYPDISPNELKICALIKLNLSIKEMAGILNISPDSVKTARYTPRKKIGIKY